MSKFDALLPRLKGEILEISLGDEYEEQVTSDTVFKVQSVIYGMLKDVVDDFLEIDCCYLNKDGEVKFGNVIWINTLQIKLFTKLKSNGSLNDVLMSAIDSRKMKHLLGLDG